MNGKPKIGLLTGGYFEYWAMYPGLKEIVEKEMQHLAESLEDEAEIVWSGLADTNEKTEAAGKEFRQEDIDLLVICEGTYFPDYMPIQAIDRLPNVPILMLLTQPHDYVPADLDYRDAIHHSFGMVGVMQLTGCFSKMRRSFEMIIGALDDPSLPVRVVDYARTVTAVRRLRSINIGIIGHTFQGMYDLELDKTKMKSKLGVNVIYLEMAELLATWRDVTEAEAEAVAGDLANKYTCQGPKQEDIRNACRLGLAMERVAEKYNLSGISHLCQHLIHVETGTTPCYAASRLIDKGVMVACEGDIGNLVCMCLIHQLTGEVACFVEWGMYDTNENAVLMVHHGAASPSLAKCDADVCITPTGEKWGFKGTGASFRFMGKPGRVTLASMIDDADGWRMLITGGEAIDAPCRPYFGQQFMVKVDRPVKEYLETLCRRGVTHHAILSYGDLTEKLRRVTRLLDIGEFVV